MQDRRPALLVFRSAALGDFIIATPALRMLRLTFPDHRIVLLSTLSANKAVRDSVARYSPADRMPWVHLAMPHLVDEFVALDVSMSLRYLLRMRAALRPHRFDKAVLLLDPGAPWPGRFKKLLLLSILAGPLALLGWRAKGSVNGNRAELHRTGVLRHHVHGPLQFLAELSPPRRYSEADVRFDLRPPAAATAWAEDWLREHVPPGSRLVFIAPGSIQPHKRWPLAKFQALCRALLAEAGDLFFIVIGTGTDHALGLELQQLAPQRFANIAGSTSVSQSAALLRHAQLLVGNDGGAMHLGDAMGAKVVSIVPGIQYPDSIEPWGSRALAVRHPVPCAPCYNFVECPLQHNRCMTELPEAAVLEKCLAVLRLHPALAPAAPVRFQNLSHPPQEP